MTAELRALIEEGKATQCLTLPPEPTTAQLLAEALETALAEIDRLNGTR